MSSALRRYVRKRASLSDRRLRSVARARGRKVSGVRSRASADARSHRRRTCIDRPPVRADQSSNARAAEAWGHRSGSDATAECLVAGNWPILTTSVENPGPWRALPSIPRFDALGSVAERSAAGSRKRSSPLKERRERQKEGRRHRASGLAARGTRECVGRPMKRTLMLLIVSASLAACADDADLPSTPSSPGAKTPGRSMRSADDSAPILTDDGAAPTDGGSDASTDDAAEPRCNTCS